jgi:hypothetical protein
VHVSDGNRRWIIAKSAGRCNKCKKILFKENEFCERARLGDDAHIYSRSDFGPRSNSNLSKNERNNANNLILLCKNCHSEVDQQPVHDSLLREIRNSHYNWVDERLGPSLSIKPTYDYLVYINVPRVDMYAAAHSIPIPVFNFESAKSFYDLNFQAGRVMAQYAHVLSEQELYARTLDRNTEWADIKIGTYWFVLKQGFYAKGVCNSDGIESKWERGESVLYRDHADEWRMVCLIDPRWITTSSSFSTFRGDMTSVSGILHINAIDPTSRRVTASPLFLGIIR